MASKNKESTTELDRQFEELLLELGITSHRTRLSAQERKKLDQIFPD